MSSDYAKNSTSLTLNQPLILSVKQQGQAVTGLRPKVWLSLRRSEQVATETSCEAKVRNFASGQLATRADVDLNSYFVVTLNQDKTVTFLNPLVSWSSGKLAGVVQLPAQGLDWALTQDGTLYVTMPDASQVAVIDTKARRLVTNIATGQGSKPARIRLAPDQQSLWVGLDGSPKLTVIDRAGKSGVTFIEAGAGLHQIGLSSDSRYVAVTNTEANTVSLFDTKTLKKLADIPVPGTPLKPVWVAKAERFYVAAINDGSLSVIDPVQLKVETQIDVGRGVTELATDPGGRYVWVVNQLQNKAFVVDAADNRKVAYANLPAEPDQLAFSADYVYFRGLASEKFALINHNQLKQISSLADQSDSQLLELSVTLVQAGEKAPAVLPEAIGVSAMMAPLPDQNGMMIASAADKSLYYYAEGMMVVMGSLDNSRRAPRGLLLLDNSLHETSPGEFSAPVSVREPGNYDVAVMLDQPRIVHCFTAKFSGEQPANPPSELQTVKPVLLPQSDMPQPNVETVLTVQFNDAASGKPVSGIRDARLLAFELPNWKRWVWLQEVSEGIYQASVTFPHVGNFNVLVEARSKNLESNNQALQTVKVAQPTIGKELLTQQ
ncbi:YncE family protein [Methylomonas fluvii]|uniref:YncE family protein n=1 Tax=Methylomonas fluvii TaxID=1854564 RepID=A0ABR9DHP7_9GAMM|nr:YncE family protein [Methylomonas fluvii]MBD9361749.1 YncE family protein [Methylomonas fluvii]